MIPNSLLPRVMSVAVMPKETHRMCRNKKDFFLPFIPTTQCAYTVSYTQTAIEIPIHIDTCKHTHTQIDEDIHIQTHRDKNIYRHKHITHRQTCV